MEDLVGDYWWLIFPVFGMAMAVYEMWEAERRANRVIAHARRRLEGK